MTITITPTARAQAEALGVALTPSVVAERMQTQDPPVVDDHRTYRLGRPSRARVVVQGDGSRAVVVAVLSSSPHITGGVDRGRGDLEAQEDRRRGRNRGDAPLARPGRRHGLSPEGETPPMLVRMDAATRGALAELAAESDLAQSEVVRRLIRHPRAAGLLVED